MFAAKTVRDGAVATVRVSGQVDIASADRLGSEIDRALQDRPSSLVIDLSLVNLMDSHGFAVLVGVCTEIVDGVRLVIGPRSDRVARMFKLMMLDTTFEFEPPLH